jgi:nucleotide-binding universal stress UspA family protein
MSKKERLTVTIDPEILDAGLEAVSAGRAESLSAWVNHALAERVARERRLSSLADAIAQYEAEFGVISEEEILQQARADRASALVVRGSPRRKSSKRRGSAA